MSRVVATNHEIIHSRQKNPNKTTFMSPSTFRALALATAATCALMSSAHATAYKWTYVGTAATQTWSTATNWDTNGVPVNDGTADVTFTDYASNGYQMKLDCRSELQCHSKHWCRRYQPE